MGSWVYRYSGETRTEEDRLGVGDVSGVRLLSRSTENGGRDEIGASPGVGARSVLGPGPRRIKFGGPSTQGWTREVGGVGNSPSFATSDRPPPKQNSGRSRVEETSRDLFKGK